MAGHHLVLPPAALLHHGHVLPPEAASLRLPVGEAALAAEEVEAGRHGHQQLEAACNEGHLGEAVQVGQDAGAGAGHEPPRTGQRAPHPGNQTLKKLQSKILNTELRRCTHGRF